VCVARAHFFPFLFAGVSTEMIRNRRAWEQLTLQVLNGPPLPDPPLKLFKPKFPNIPVLADYRQKAGPDFWSRFPSNLICPASPTINLKQLKFVVNALGTSDTVRLERVFRYIQHGADIGCKGSARMPSQSTNAKSAYEHGPQVTDAIAEWVQKGYAFGPVPRHMVPAEAKISGIMVRPKPNGSVRVILNLSAPKGRSVNDGIDKDDFPAKMSSTGAWLEVLNWAGRRCLLTKTDWAAAYKQICVREQDTNLQWFSWAGMYFKELCLIFGSASSAGIFDDAAKVVLDLVCRKANFPRHMVCQHLDDVCAAYSATEADKLFQFDKAFSDIAATIGVQLAPRDDPEKSFAPTTHGIVFGIHYDTISWTWAVPIDKLANLHKLIDSAIADRQLDSKSFKSLAGKIIHIKPLVPAGRFNVDKIMATYAQANKHDLVHISPACCRQLKFWRLFTQVCSGRIAIPKIPGTASAAGLHAFTDAAGGTLETVGRGSGGVMGSWWFYVPWPRRVNAGGWKVDGRKVGRKLSALELVGPLVVVTAAHLLCRQQTLTIWVDNAGSVEVFRKGYSRSCRLCTTLVKAISTIAAAIGCNLHIAKITRCSSPGAAMADHLSKGKFTLFRELASNASWPLDTAPARIPTTLLQWIDKPFPCDSLGHQILREISLQAPIPGYSAW
jgi:hypothetical protein